MRTHSFCENTNSHINANDRIGMENLLVAISCFIWRIKEIKQIKNTIVTRIGRLNCRTIESRAAPKCVFVSSKLNFEYSTVLGDPYSLAKMPHTKNEPLASATNRKPCHCLLTKTAPPPRAIAGIRMLGLNPVEMKSSNDALIQDNHPGRFGHRTRPHAVNSVKYENEYGWVRRPKTASAKGRRHKKVVATNRPKAAKMLDGFSGSFESLIINLAQTNSRAKNERLKTKKWAKRFKCGIAMKERANGMKFAKRSSPQ